MSQSLPTISKGPLTLTLNPAIGGSIADFTCSVDGRDWPVFRGAEPGRTEVTDMGSFPLLPWVNRIKNHGFDFRGRHIALTSDPAVDPSPLHGHGWKSPWSIEQVEESRCELGFRYQPGEWPWAYSARQLFELDGQGLTIWLSCTNEADTPMPCGLGHHPYFHCGAETRLDTKVDVVWTIDELVLPVEKVPAEGRFSMVDRKVCAQDLDHGFGGWGQRTVISDPEWPFDIAFSSPTARFFQLYSPPQGGFFVAEPVTHANAALNAPEADWPKLGIQVLEPGETMTLESRFEVIAR
ncbi:aldose 1-epimerase [Sphingomonas piscis]|uniref:Aldose 1-epimerase n=1 Tax=Sphingomonas piscis TaxID=2714943 RepID=A0A6G7YQC0_9SPHN|nr:aldose 1-epimerase [Sphingomonas piscis]QIK78929.1 aldose 1-epimerase [Sphingomonas piscis]